MPVRISPAKIHEIQRALLVWFRRRQRDLPWRRTRDPYAILVSEAMLQQTQVDRVIPKYREWLEQFPTVRALARASVRDVLLAWAGLGYNRRALYLHRAAQDIVARFGGRVPTTVGDLTTLPGVGKYTAAAVATFTTGTPHVLVETNVRRVILRLFAGVNPPPSETRERAVFRLVERTMPRLAIRGVPASHWGHAVMDFGALICRSRPRCHVCPLQRSCRAYPAVLTRRRPLVRDRNPAPSLSSRSHLFPDRIYRGRIIQVVRDRDPRSVPVRSIGPAILPGFSAADSSWLQALLDRLVDEGFLHWLKSGTTAVQLPR